MPRQSTGRAARALRSSTAPGAAGARAPPTRRAARWERAPAPVSGRRAPRRDLAGKACGRPGRGRARGEGTRAAWTRVSVCPGGAPFRSSSQAFTPRLPAPGERRTSSRFESGPGLRAGTMRAMRRAQTQASAEVSGPLPARAGACRSPPIPAPSSSRSRAGRPLARSSVPCPRNVSPVCASP